MTGKREQIDTGNDKRYVRRDEKGRFDEVVDVGRSLTQDRKRDAKGESSQAMATGATARIERRALSRKAQPLGPNPIPARS